VSSHRVGWYRTVHLPGLRPVNTEKASSGDLPRYVGYHRYARGRARHSRVRRKLTAALPHVFEVLDGAVGSSTIDVVSVRQELGGVRSLELNDQISLEAARIKTS